MKNSNGKALYHPAKDNYINNHPHTLHLWKPKDVELPTPKNWMVGIKNK